MKKITALLIGLFLFATLNVFAQDPVTPDSDSRARRRSADKSNNEYKHSLGLAAGFTTGYGLSYRFLPKKFGVQATFAPFNNDNVSQYSAGLTFLWKLTETHCADLFIYESTHFFYRKEYHNNDFWSSYYAEDNGGSLTRQVNCGFGAGVEFKMGRVNFDLMIGYAGYQGFKKVNLTAESGIYFIF